MKNLFVTALTLFSLSSFAQTEEKVTIPKGVVYNYCDPKIVEATKKAIKDNLTDSSNYSIIGDMIIVGPMLWARFKNIENIKSIKNGNTTFKVDKQDFEGKMTQTLADSKKLWYELRKEINTKPYIIRKFTESELGYYWAVISFDIDEPLLILETDEHRYILNVLKKDVKLFWLDEVPKSVKK